MSETFAFTPENKALFDKVIAKYPAGRQASGEKVETYMIITGRPNEVVVHVNPSLKPPGKWPSGQQPRPSFLLSETIRG